VRIGIIIGTTDTARTVTAADSLIYRNASTPETILEGLDCYLQTLAMTDERDGTAFT
jgi:hypothetical protein